MRDLIAPTTLVILLNLDPKHWFLDLIKTIGNLFHAPRSYAYYSIAICDFELELSSTKAQIGAKSLIFAACMTLKFHGWHWKNNRAPPLCHFKLCALFHSHLWIQTGVTVQKHSIQVKIRDFFVQSDLEIWWMTLTNNTAPLLCHFNFVCKFEAICKFKLELRSRNAPN